MYVEISRRVLPAKLFPKRKAQYLGQTISDREYLTCRVCKSVRKDGKPRRQTVVYLGSIHIRQIEDRELQPISNFWKDVRRNWSDEISGDDAERILAKLQETVPPLTDDEQAELDAYWKRFEHPKLSATMET